MNVTKFVIRSKENQLNSFRYFELPILTPKIKSCPNPSLRVGQSITNTLSPVQLIGVTKS